MDALPMSALVVITSHMRVLKNDTHENDGHDDEHSEKRGMSYLAV